MQNISEVLDAQIRGESVVPNPNNKVTTRRKNTHRNIAAKANNDSNAMYAMSMNEIENYVPRLQEFVLEHSEEPAPEIPDLVKQVYQLRMMDINDLSEMIGYDNEQALTFLEQQEDTFERDYGYIQDSFLGAVWSPIEIAYNHMTQPDNIDGTLLTSVFKVAGTKVNSATLIRAAKGKPAGVLGALSTGGTSHYDALRTYFRNNPTVAQQVIKGQITDESQLPNWIAPTPTDSGVGGQIATQYTNTQIQRLLPWIIVSVVVLLVLVYFVSQRKK